MGTCVRAARARWTPWRPCRHLRYRNPGSGAHLSDASVWPKQRLLPHIGVCYADITAPARLYKSWGPVYVQRVRAGHHGGHAGTSDTEIRARVPISQMLVFGLSSDYCPT